MSAAHEHLTRERDSPTTAHAAIQSGNEGQTLHSISPVLRQWRYSRVVPTTGSGFQAPATLTGGSRQRSFERLFRQGTWIVSMPCLDEIIGAASAHAAPGAAPQRPRSPCISPEESGSEAQECAINCRTPAVGDLRRGCLKSGTGNRKALTFRQIRTTKSNYRPLLNW